jgi:hypothetical protein
MPTFAPAPLFEVKIEGDDILIAPKNSGLDPRD